MAWRLWLQGLVAAFISAFAGAGALVIVDPTKFNLFQGGAKTLGEVGLVLGVSSALSYLKTHPTPDEPAGSVSPSTTAALNKTAVVLVIALGLAGLLAVNACSQSTRHIATVTVVTEHSVLGGLQDFATANFCGTPTALPSPACIDHANRLKLDAFFSKAFDEDGKIAQIVRNAPVGTPPNTAALVSDVATLVGDIVAALPPSLQAKAAALVNSGGK